MAYMNQERKATIAKNLKPILAKYGVKGSLRVRNHSSITLTIQSGKIDFIADMADNYLSGICSAVQVDRDALRDDYCIQVNPYHYERHYNGKSRQFFSEVITALKSADYYDNSDIMTDYFCVAYYYNIDIGKWNKPYQLEV